MAIVQEIDFSDWARQLRTKSIPEFKSLMRQGHIVLALEELAYEQSRGNILNPVQFVDNLPKKKLKNVKFGGRIEYRDLSQFSEEGGPQTVNVLREAMGILRASSPTRDANYILGHIPFYNGKQVSPGSNTPLENGDTLVIANSMPYAKRLEGVAQPKQQQIGKNIRKKITTFNRNNQHAIKAGFTEKMKPSRNEKAVLAKSGKYTPGSKEYMSTQTPNGIYPVAQKKLQRQFRGLLDVTFTYWTMPQFTGKTYGQTRGPSYWQYIASLYKENGRAVVFPVLVITLSAAAVSGTKNLQFN